MASLVASPHQQSKNSSHNDGCHDDSNASWHASQSDDEVLLSEPGITYHVVYCGSIDVLRPMKDLDFQSRTLLARECIDRIYYCINASPSSPPNRSQRPLSQYVGSTPNLTHSMVPVEVSVNTDRLIITDRENSTNQLGYFQLSLVSFASKGDDEVAACVAFVAKDAEKGRACHVMMAPCLAVAKQLIATLGRAFDLKFTRLLAQRNQAKVEQQGLTPQHHNDGYIDDSDGDALSRDYVNDSSLNSSLQRSQTPRSRQGLVGQPWFHGTIDREEAEMRLVASGDFLVRESARNQHQFVLSGRTADSGTKHLLLVDSDGVVRTRDRAFSSVAHLVQHHHAAATPIISHDVDIYLLHAVDVSNFSM